MRRAINVIPAGNWPENNLTGCVTLVFDDRHRRRIQLTDDRGEDFLLDLSETTRINNGDGLAIDDGSFLKVLAADEDIIDISCDGPIEIARVAWHLGNRHTPVQVLSTGYLRIRYDHVLLEMAQGLGAAVRRKHAPFEPEAGAYSGGGHGHIHDP
jgi:urease accessory protein